MLAVVSYYFFALLNPRDQAHARALELSRELASPILTTSWVLAEVADGLASTRKRQHFGHLLDGLRRVPANRIVAPSEVLFERGTAFYLSRPDKEWTLTDCISFVVMRDAGVSEALTGDRHFEQAGFVALLL
jgi:predicted nucleic acid-binding protein